MKNGEYGEPAGGGEYNEDQKLKRASRRRTYVEKIKKSNNKKRRGGERPGNTDSESQGNLAARLHEGILLKRGGLGGKDDTPKRYSTKKHRKRLE